MTTNYFKQKNHHHQTAFITGATGGLGKAFAVECASRGWDVILTDRSDALLESLASGLRTATESG
jgi:uncharacterized protein